MHCNKVGKSRNLLPTFTAPNRGGLNSTQIYGTRVPVEEPSIASGTAYRTAKGEEIPTNFTCVKSDAL